MSDLNKMVQVTREVLKNSYSPYSKFPVGACIQAANGELFYGCNVENASYSLTLCAEAAAIAQMVAAGQRQIKQIVVMGTGTELCAPCGACRQRLREFAALDALVHICDVDSIRKTVTVGELLPLSFGPHNLEKKRDTISD